MRLATCWICGGCQQKASKKEALINQSCLHTNLYKFDVTGNICCRQFLICLCNYLQLLHCLPGGWPVWRIGWRERRGTSQGAGGLFHVSLWGKPKGFLFLGHQGFDPHPSACEPETWSSCYSSRLKCGSRTFLVQVFASGGLNIATIHTNTHAE